MIRRFKAVLCCLAKEKKESDKTPKPRARNSFQNQKRLIFPLKLKFAYGLKIFDSEKHEYSFTGRKNDKYALKFNKLLCYLTVAEVFFVE